jgi:hypothetical protein
LEGRIRARLSRSEGRRFGLTVGAAFLVLAGLSFWRGHSLVPTVLATIGGAMVLGGLLLPGHMSPVYHRWMGLAHAISKVTTPVFMSIVYYLVLTPAGLIMRLFGHRPLVAKQTDGGYWVAKEADRHSDLSRQF